MFAQSILTALVVQRKHSKEAIGTSSSLGLVTPGCRLQTGDRALLVAPPEVVAPSEVAYWRRDGSRMCAVGVGYEVAKLLVDSGNSAYVITLGTAGKVRGLHAYALSYFTCVARSGARPYSASRFHGKCAQGIAECCRSRHVCCASFLTPSAGHAQLFDPSREGYKELVPTVMKKES